MPIQDWNSGESAKIQGVNMTKGKISFHTIPPPTDKQREHLLNEFAVGGRWTIRRLTLSELKEQYPEIVTKLDVQGINQ